MTLPFKQPCLNVDVAYGKADNGLFSLSSMVSDDTYMEKLRMNSPEVNRWRLLFSFFPLLLCLVVLCIIRAWFDVKKMEIGDCSATHYIIIRGVH